MILLSYTSVQDQYDMLNVCIESLEALINHRPQLEEGQVEGTIDRFKVSASVMDNIFEGGHDAKEVYFGYEEKYLVELQKYAVVGVNPLYPVGHLIGADPDISAKLFRIYSTLGMNMYGRCSYGQAHWTYILGLTAFFKEAVQYILETENVEVVYA